MIVDAGAAPAGVRRHDTIAAMTRDEVISEEAVKEMLRIYLEEIERFLGACLNDRDLPPNLLEACRHAVLGGGKRLRPLLTVLSCEACGGEWRTSLPAAAATELVHAFSLVHDDLPSMDNDELRRGMPTVWKRHGEAMAVLAGDALQSIAFELLCGASIDLRTSGALIRELADATTRMIAGQVYDTLGGLPARFSDHERLETIHRNKTGALLRASCRMGAIAAGASGTAMARITTFGESVGLMFQIVDDLLDVEQSTEHTGKATGKDRDAGKLTFPGVVGINASRAEIARLHATAIDSIAPFGPAARDLAHLCDFLAVRTK